MRILGLSAYYHDAAAALLVDGRIVAAAQEERFSRVKHDPRFPIEAARSCLRQGGLAPDDLDAIAFYEKPFWKFDRILQGIFDEAPRGAHRFLRAVPAWLTSRLWVRADIERRLGSSAPLRFLAHHESHAASAYGPSPFARAAVLTLDGVGEWTTNALWQAEGPRLTPLAEIRYPHSLGLLYSAFTSYCGFKVNDGEYKLMGLAPFGEPRYVATIFDHLIDLRADGSYRLNPEFFAYRYRERMTSTAFHRLFGGPPRAPGRPIGRREADLARSIQAVTEEALLRQARFARAQSGADALCLAGGVALNCVANGRLARERIFEHLWIQPAAGDAGGALGAAYALWLRAAAPARVAAAADGQGGSLLGPGFSDEELEAALPAAGLRHVRKDDDELVDEAARALAAGEVIGWFQGRMEFGPRALGNRSILADPRDPAMQSKVNQAIKERESFRPFAPVVRDSDAGRWFDLPAPSPYMLLTAAVAGAEPLPNPAAELQAGTAGPRSGSPIPAVTHVDGSARVQSVAAGANPLLERLLERFGAVTGCGVLLNTSFNGRDEPIVCTPSDAIAAFVRLRLDRLFLGPFSCRRDDAAGRPPVRSAARPRRPWRRAAVELTAALAASALLWLVVRAPPAAIVGLTLGVGLACLRLSWPAARAAVDRGAAALGRGLGILAGWPPLTVVFVLVITPAAVVGRLRRRSRRRPDGSSLWESPRDPDHDPRRPF